jgi:hypothetical protein
MVDNQIRYYDANLGKAYLTSLLGDYDYYQLNREEKDLVNVIEALSVFQKTGRILLGPRKYQPKEFKGDTGRIITDFIAHREGTLKLSKNTIKNYVFHLYPFYCHMIKIEVKHISDIKASEILWPSAIKRCSLY